MPSAKNWGEFQELTNEVQYYLINFIDFFSIQYRNRKPSFLRTSQLISRKHLIGIVDNTSNWPPNNRVNLTRNNIKNFFQNDNGTSYMLDIMSNICLTPFRYLFTQKQIDGSLNPLYKHIIHMDQK